ncbi:large ribosomal subunit protein mL41A-like [Branchiostoma lanceolatum]|uniref:large ribosomal subunit protein mL41A-like n=1 Tax=Branchiostoma lanceolatum TaxID=7740 RepID=UPI0034539A2F
MPLVSRIIRGLTRGADRSRPWNSKMGTKYNNMGRGAPELVHFKKGQRIVMRNYIPQYILPDLTGFELKPYVTPKVPEVHCDPVTPKDIFDVCCAPEIEAQFKEGETSE